MAAEAEREAAAAEQAAAEQAKAEQAAADKAAADKAAAAAAKASARAAPAPPPRTATGAASSPTDDFDRDYALLKAQDVIDDLRSIDERMQDGIMAASRLHLLGGNYGRLQSAGVLPKTDAAQYIARLRTLEEFAEQAADQMGYAPTEGSARYQVIRQETGVLFDQLNAALGTILRLP